MIRAYSKDGAMRVINVTDPVYAPNSKGGPQADTEHNQPNYWYSDGNMVRSAYTLREADDDWGQAGTLVREVLDDAARERPVMPSSARPKTCSPRSFRWLEQKSLYLRLLQSGQLADVPGRYASPAGMIPM